MYNEDRRTCVGVKDDFVVGSSCNTSDPFQHWSWENDFQLKNKMCGKCIDVVDGALQSWKKLRLSVCDHLFVGQNWKCIENLVHVTGTNLYMNFGNANQYVILFHGDGLWSQWKIFGMNANICAAKP
jgi:hypothetical protein